MTLTIKTRDRASARILDILKTKGRRGYAIAAKAMEKTLRAHFVKMDARPNRMGWPKTHFFAKARTQTHSVVFDNKAEAHVSLVGFKTLVTGFPQTITPVNRKYLTIPATADAYGKRAREFNDLRFGYSMTDSGVMAPALIKAEQTAIRFGRKRKDGRRKILQKTGIGGEVYYWLVKVVHPKPHQWAVPTAQEMKEAVARELLAYADSL